MKTAFSFLLLILMLLATSCAGSINHAVAQADTQPVEFNHAKLISIESADSFHIVRITNPWDTTRLLRSYILIHDSVKQSVDMPGATVVRIPLKRAVVYSTIHTQLLDELGAGNAVKGVADVQYITDSLTLARLRSGEITDCGNHAAPDVERIISTASDGILLSPYENGGSGGKLAATGIPLIECADYLEESPLGRAEWIKFFGLLTGRYDAACEIFAAEEARYDSLRASVENVAYRPEVLMDAVYSGVWYVPRRDSTTARYLRDAGASSPFDDMAGTGSAALSPEKVVIKAGESPIWLVRYSQASPMTLEQLRKENNLCQALAAWKNGNVWGANSADEDYFSIIPFHPSVFLEDLIRVIHPEAIDTVSPRFFHKLK